MTIDMLFLILIPLYLATIAYGVVGARRRGAPGRLRMVVTVLMVLVPPLAILYALHSTGEPALIAAWGMVAWAMLASGAATAVFTELVARRVGA
ncbi:hypothetical protein [uncultured Sphingomonas sp.]|uniref:hypothetical protein n=1 Tax=uncultured Sphingomonas sp. TaxID=158754 RepID=UPI0025E6C1E7|nr:hypothetical protein [uncultured Sphingomonas sp.]